MSQLTPVLSHQNALLPVGLRQKDQTSKKATGTFDRDSLLKYLEKEAMEYKDRDDIVPFTGEKKGVCMCFCSLLLIKQNINTKPLKRVCLLDGSSKTDKQMNKQQIFQVLSNLMSLLKIKY